MNDQTTLTRQAVELLRRLISTPRQSRDEGAAADIMEAFIADCQLPYRRVGHNIIVGDEASDDRPTLLMNAHIDTVRPAASWTRDPYSPDIEGDRLYGIGANDCGGGLVSLLTAYRLLRHEPTPYHLMYVASAEEEVSGANGFSLVLPELPHIDVAIVGEPTGMQPAIAEKGLMVVDGLVRGKSGHAARNEGINAISLALDDLVWLRDFHFDRVSAFLGPTKASVTVINSGTQHNVVPDECRFTIDVRTNELYTNAEALAILQQGMHHAELHARSTRLSSSHIAADHPLVRRCVSLGMTPFGSPTLSDQALMPFPSLKLGPGQSSRSHGADEFIGISEIATAVDTYVKLLS